MSPTRSARGTSRATQKKGTTAGKARPGTKKPGAAPTRPPARTTQAAPRSSKARAKAGGGAGDSGKYRVVLRYRDGAELREVPLTTNDRELYPHAQKWRYVVANRQRITRATRETLAADLFQMLQTVTRLGDGELDSHVKAIARGGVVEVAIPFEEESRGWAARVFPWENVIGLVTKPYRSETTQLTVVRHLDCSPQTLGAERPRSLLVVRSGPGELATLYDLEQECVVVAETLGAALPKEGLTVLHEPDRDLLERAVRSGSPSVVHLVGVDPLVLTAYSLAAVDRGHQDGFVLRGAAGQYDCVDPMALAGLLTAGSQPPTLVAVSACYSAPRVAALAVACGARHAIGFLDSVTDSEALLFFNVLYRAWARSWDLLSAFEAARARLMRQVSTPGGCGVVLWSRESPLTPRVAAVAVRGKEPEVEERAATVDDLRLSVRTGPEAGPGGGRRREPSLNYSLLHNDRSPFASFFVDKPYPGKLPPLRVEVALEVGSEICRCRFSEELPESATPVELAGKIRLPLVAGLLRQCTESLRTNLYVKVECGDRLLCERSDRVTLLPADEWRDDGEDHRWLPSFVLPRDPAVLRVVTAAGRYLRTLLDDCSAGFDGYQQLADNDHNAADVVDPQVQAIWAALQHDLPLAYVNPPPSYTSLSQRLRSPTQVFQGNAATCVDLALLFASCLELIGVYPVIFLVTGHAFPGYWRSDKAWWRMRQFRFKEEPAGVSGLAGATADRNEVTRGQTEGWMFEGVDNLAELLRYVEAGVLAPFEGTSVTARGGFFAALEAGAGHLHPDTFDAMVDVQTARGENVTPLPLLFDTRG